MIKLRYPLAALAVCAVLLVHVNHDLEVASHTHLMELRQDQMEQRLAQMERERELECLARNIYFEARSESERGQRAVAWVTLNRVKSSQYPNSVCAVISQARTDARGNPLRYQCQFSWYCDGRPDTPASPTAWARAVEIARDVQQRFQSGRAQDPTRGALFYHAVWLENLPAWAGTRTPTVQVGQHQFYR